MVFHDNLYSRFVAWAKVLLPIAALLILSTLFLFSKSIDPTTTIPFTTVDLRERASVQQVTSPEFAGATEDGDLITFRAASARPDTERASRLFAKELDARIDLASGSVITFRAVGGVVDDAADRAELNGDVEIQSSLGYVVTTDQLISGMRRIHAESTGPIQGSGPPGDFTAGRMLITAPGADDSVQMLFTDGVKLLYDPPDPKE